MVVSSIGFSGNTVKRELSGVSKQSSVPGCSRGFVSNSVSLGVQF